MASAILSFYIVCFYAFQEQCLVVVNYLRPVILLLYLLDIIIQPSGVCSFVLRLSYDTCHFHIISKVKCIFFKYAFIKSIVIGSYQRTRTHSFNQRWIGAADSMPVKID